MAANPINVVDTLRAVQYDGTNSADIIALDPGFAFDNASEANGVWSFQSPPSSASFVVHTGEWLLFAQNQVFSKVSNVDRINNFSCNVLCEDIEPLTALASLPLVSALGVAPVPALLASATAEVMVTLQPAMADDTYSAYAHKFAGVALDDLQINSVTVVDEDTVTVAVENTGSQTIAGASIMVHAVA
jgi:hypothetical protein